MPRSTTHPGEWLSLGPASRLVGVDPDTLRRWSDEGRVDVFTTPGGHRRFARASLERLVETRRGRATAMPRFAPTAERLSRACRRSYAGRGSTSTRGVASAVDPERDAFRHDGRRLVAALVTYLDVTDAAGRAAVEAEAAGIVEDLGRRLAAAGTSVDEAIGLFVAARRPFMTELGAIVRRRALPTAQVVAVYDRAAALLDRLLLRLVAAHREAA